MAHAGARGGVTHHFFLLALPLLPFGFGAGLLFFAGVGFVLGAAAFLVGVLLMGACFAGVFLGVGLALAGAFLVAALGVTAWGSKWVVEQDQRACIVYAAARQPAICSPPAASPQARTGTPSSNAPWASRRRARRRPSWASPPPSWGWQPPSSWARPACM